MNINAAIIGMGIGQKHFEAIEVYKNSRVKIICEKNVINCLINLKGINSVDADHRTGNVFFKGSNYNIFTI